MPRIVSTLALGTLFLACGAPQAPAQEGGTARQIVLISFDGAHDNALWERSRKLGEETGAHFTYFVSCVFLSDRAGFAAYKAPGHKRASSNVGFAPDKADALARLGHIWQAASEGHEIGSHGCGHFNGETWTNSDWRSEFAEFHAYMRDGWRINGAPELEPAGWRDFADGEIKGFRAPYLATGPALYQALAAEGFSFDASAVSNGPSSPDLSGPVARFALPMIAEGPAARAIIAMDYNLFVRHSGGLENPAKSAEFEERAYHAFRNAYDGEIAGERRPLEIGFHFVEMNGGAYWRALERFARDVCPRADTECVTYSEALSLLSPEKTARDGS